MDEVPGSALRAIKRAGVLWHEALGAGKPNEYQDHLITVLHYGSKVAGLQIMPAAWVPPFAALPAWISEEWLLHRDTWLETAKANGVDIAKAYQIVNLQGEHRVIVRSSGVGEGLDDRGRYKSILLEKGATNDALLRAIESIFADFEATGRHPQMGICIQRHFEPDLAGHVSNEVHLSATRNQWKFEVEQPSYAPYQGLNSKFANPPSEIVSLRTKGQKGLSHSLRRVCHWINLRVDGRTHVEWCVAGGRLWVVQVDQESPFSAGLNPHLAPTIHCGSSQSLPPAEFLCFERYRIGAPSPWKKLNNIRDFWIGKEAPKHRLFVARADRVKDALGDPQKRRLLSREINHLTSGRAVLRTDCRDRKIGAFNLPRTHTVRGLEAVAWLKKTIAHMEERGASPKNVAFILHQYIPARAAAWSYYSPGDDLVRIDCLWGLPDGLQFLSHDSFQLDARTGQELAAEVRFKRNFLQEQADGSWQYVTVARQFGRDRVLSSEALRSIAQQTVAVARHVNERAQIMWFCDLPQELQLGTHIPWYRSKDYLAHSQIDRPPFRVRPLRNLTDLKTARAEKGQFILRLEPEVELVRADERFLDAVIEIANEKGAPVELAGSVLGHAYYKLRRAGVLVLAPQPKYQRTRGKQAHLKLVRDSIPESIASRGEQVSFGRLSRSGSVIALVAKLFEEGLEVKNSTSQEERLEELADVLEVLRGLATIDEINWGELTSVANAKRAKRGGFEHQLVLLETGRPKPQDRQQGRLDHELSESRVSLDEMGRVFASQGRLSVPFTRLLGSSQVQAEIPFDEGRLSLTIGLSASGVSVAVTHASDLEAVSEDQPGLFDEIESSHGPDV